MKKILLITVMSLGSLTAFAQETEAEINVDTEVAATAETQDDFSAIELSEVPAAITEALSRDYPDAEINNAFVNEEEQYKLEVTLEDGNTAELYADSEGNWLDM
ncbi:hypothetical protein [Zeaxanthinibacter enoshimensis]|uniref:PepSY-like beta-lactamase-inhibitor n=1 Tax=Zeaxanthinibacter enoshimensis TaxID=392009 RepID=A0A4R6TW51_9FLAO|nr:hypothetical protein [Zeaxanthinibacter enoshimensis]TDQ33178.1 hypothetical protein CLV82_1016 [Zeaxanthinibacter enoshimensis]